MRIHGKPIVSDNRCSMRLSSCRWLIRWLESWTAHVTAHTQTAHVAQMHPSDVCHVSDLVQPRSGASPPGVPGWNVYPIFASGFSLRSMQKLIGTVNITQNAPKLFYTKMHLFLGNGAHLFEFDALLLAGYGVVQRFGTWHEMRCTTTSHDMECMGGVYGFCHVVLYGRGAVVESLLYNTFLLRIRQQFMVIAGRHKGCV